MKLPRGSNFERVAGQAALCVAHMAGLPPRAAEDLEMAVCEACTGLGGRFFVGACQDLVVRIQIRPEAIRILVFGDGVRSSGPEGREPLNPHDADMSLCVLRGLMDKVTLFEHQRRGFCLTMISRRER